MTTQTHLGRWFSTSTGKFISIGVLILILLIPIGMVESVIYERHQTYREASAEITQSWGQEICISDPVLTLPQSSKTPRHSGGFIYNVRYEHLLPEQATLNGHIDTQIRKRGIYKVPVYTGNVNIKGYFQVSDDLLLAQDYKKKVALQMVLNSRALKKAPILKWHGKTIPMTARKSSQSGNDLVFMAELEDVTDLVAGQNPFELNLDLSGSYALSFHSSARESEIQLSSNWPSPGFFGTTLPLSHDISDTGFNASWKNSNFFSDIGHKNHREIEPAWFSYQSAYGVRFIQTVDTYQQVTRVVKYAVLFLMLIFAVYFLHETLGKALLHPIQYLFIGFALCVFYLLLLSLAEHIDFNLAYFISALCSALLIALYSVSILNSRAHGMFIFIKLSILYGFLLVILKSEDFALLIGSIGMFVILAVIMYFTRNFDWRRSVADSAVEA